MDHQEPRDEPHTIKLRIKQARIEELEAIVRGKQARIEELESDLRRKEKRIEKLIAARERRRRLSNKFLKEVEEINRKVFTDLHNVTELSDTFLLENVFEQRVQPHA